MRMKEWIGKRSIEPQERSRNAKKKDKAENEEPNPGQQLLLRNHIRSNKLQRFQILLPNVLYRLFESWVKESISLLQLHQ